MTLHHHTHPFNDTHNQSQHHLPLSLLPLSLLLVGALLAQPGRAGAQAQDPRALLRMAESAQANGQHRAALEIIVSLRGQVPAGQLAGMLSSSELALGDYLMAEQAAIAAMREAGDAWVSQHREALMNTLAQAALHLGEVVIEGLPAGLPVSARNLELGVTGQGLRLGEGPHVLTVTLPDGRRLLVTVNVVASRSTTVDGSTASVIGSAQPTAAPAATPFSTSVVGAPAPAPSGIAPAYPPAAPTRAYAAAPAPTVAPTMPHYSGLPAGVHAAPAAGNRPLFQERPPQATPPVERAANRYGIALDLGEGYGLEYASQQSQAMDSDGYALDGFDNAAVVGGGHLFFQHDVGEHLVFVTRLGFGYHARRAVSAWNLYSDPVFDLRIRAMKGHVMRFDLGETARVAFGRQGAWISSYIGLGGRVGVALFGYTGANLWQQAGSSDVYSTPASGTEVGYLAQATLEIGNYFGQKRTIEFGGSISVGKPLLSVNFHLGVSFNGW